MEGAPGTTAVQPTAPVTDTAVKSAPEAKPDFKTWMAAQEAAGPSKPADDRNGETARSLEALVKGKQAETEPEVSLENPKKVAEAEPKSDTEPAKIKYKDRELTEADLDKLHTDYDTNAKELAQMRSEVESFVKELKASPASILSRLEAQNPEEFAKQMDDYVHDRYVKPAQFKALPPEEKLKVYEQQEAERKAAELKAKEDSEKSQQERNLTESRKVWEDRFEKALGEAQLPINEWTKARMAGYMSRALQQNPNAQVGEVVGLVRQDMVKAQSEAMKDMPPEKLIEILGPDILSKIRSHEVAKARDNGFKNTNPSQGIVNKDKTPTKPQRRFTSVHDMLDSLKKSS